MHVRFQFKFHTLFSFRQRKPSVFADEDFTCLSFKLQHEVSQLLQTNKAAYRFVHSAAKRNPVIQQQVACELLRLHFRFTLLILFFLLFFMLSLAKTFGFH
jgi:hypothetical protein